MRFEEFAFVLGCGLLSLILFHALTRDDNAEATLVAAIFIICVLLSS